MDDVSFLRALQALIAEARRGGRIPLYDMAALLVEEADVLEAERDNGAEV